MSRESDAVEAAIQRGLTAALGIERARAGLELHMQALLEAHGLVALEAAVLGAKLGVVNRWYARGAADRD